MTTTEQYRTFTNPGRTWWRLGTTSSAPSFTIINVYIIMYITCLYPFSWKHKTTMTQFRTDILNSTKDLSCRIENNKTESIGNRVSDYKIYKQETIGEEILTWWPPWKSDGPEFHFLWSYDIPYHQHCLWNDDGQNQITTAHSNFCNTHQHFGLWPQFPGNFGT